MPIKTANATNNLKKYQHIYRENCEENKNNLSGRNCQPEMSAN